MTSEYPKVVIVMESELRGFNIADIPESGILVDRPLMAWISGRVTEDGKRILILDFPMSIVRDSEREYVRWLTVHMATETYQEEKDTEFEVMFLEEMQ